MSPEMLLAVALGGAAGGVARFVVAGLITRRLGAAFPWGILCVNVSGSLVLGIAAGVALSTWAGLQAVWWPVLAVGVLGSYTTVSTFSLQAHGLLREGRTATAAAYVVSSLTLCLGAAALGIHGVVHATMHGAMALQGG